MTKSGNSPSGAPWRNFYGRVKGKTFHASQKRYWDEELPKWQVPNIDWQDNPDRAVIDLSAHFGNAPVWLEVGFGSGEHLVHMAQQYPDVGFIGVEPFLNGVATLLGKIRRVGVTNIRVHPGDARDLMDVLPVGSIDRAFLLYPDPWPKKRHHRRRFVTQEHLRPLACTMRAGAELRVATDIADYVRQTLVEVPQAGFSWTAQGAQDWRRPWEDWLSTRYEQKAIREGRPQHYLTFQRDPSLDAAGALG
ncbi:MAG: tRNA (guanosine(46)-N7)-methyltransferase TrmB [Pseudomonadota bacterium]